MNVGKTTVLIDGENLRTRFDEMRRQGRQPAPSTSLIGDCFVWSDSLFAGHLWNLLRVSYYTSSVGDDATIHSLEEAISHTTYKCRSGLVSSFGEKQVYQTISGRVIPHVTKRSKRSRKESVCDIAITVDALRACYRDHVDKVFIISGDGDFRSLYREIMHAGKEVIVGALSSGLNPHVRSCVDVFVDLDEHFFLPAEQSTARITSAQTQC